MSALDTCTLCPRLCRSVCPVAEGSGREAATPTRVAEVVRAWRLGQVDAELAWTAASLCVDCGQCSAYCHLSMPLPDALAQARFDLRPTTATALPEIIGAATRVLIAPPDAPELAGWLAALGDAATWLTSDSLGADLVGGPTAKERKAAIVDAARGRELIVVDGATARWLERADVPFRWLADVLGVVSTPSCVGGCTGRVRCCGGAEPLRSAHPEDARRMAARWVDEHQPSWLGDLRCARWLASCGLPVPLVAGEAP